MSSHRFSRLAQFIGEEGLTRLTASHVAIVGLGAVGSYALEGLARSGVGRLRLVDFDEVRESNFNRQLLAVEGSLGRPKVEVAAERVLAINPDCQVEPLRLFVNAESLPAVLAGPPDLVLDCIDSFRPKVELLSGALEAGVPVASSMGAALRTDPARAQTGPLSATRVCPLARRLRAELRKRGLPTDLPCVWSDEPVDNSLVREPETDEAASEYQRGRPRRVLGSLPTLTGLFGLTLANLALELLLGDLWPGRH